MEKKESVEKFLDDVVKTVKVGFDKVVAKTDQLTHMGRLKMDIMSINRDIEKNYTELGTRVYLLIAKGKNTSVNEDNQVQSLIEKIEELEERLALKKDEYDHVARSEKQAAEAKENTAADETAETVTAEDVAAGVEAEADEAAETKK
ncbi:MAG: hypothetical protein ACE5I1_27925 [bacterium]